MPPKGPPSIFGFLQLNGCWKSPKDPLSTFFGTMRQFKFLIFRNFLISPKGPSFKFFWYFATNWVLKKPYYKFKNFLFFAPKIKHRLQTIPSWLWLQRWLAEKTATLWSCGSAIFFEKKVSLKSRGTEGSVPLLILSAILKSWMRTKQPPAFWNSAEFYCKMFAHPEWKLTPSVFHVFIQETHLSSRNNSHHFECFGPLRFVQKKTISSKDLPFY